MPLAFTLCSNNYLAQAITLGQSLQKHNPQYIFKIGLVDKKSDQVDYATIPFEIIEVENIGIHAFGEMFKRYSITELNTAVKPFCFQYFFNQANVESVIYLDPDILVYHSFTELESTLQASDIVITPHFTTPITDDKTQQEEDFLNSGLYNLGFIAIKNTDTGKKMVNWWARNLTTKAYVKFEKGMFTDQIWINFVPLYYEKVSILRHPGYNMAYWNLHERGYNGNVTFKNSEYPLCFFHFSGFNPLKPEVLSKYQNRFDFDNRTDIKDLFISYSKLLFENNFSAYIALPCIYVVEKQKLELENYLLYKKSLPLCKRIIRGIILRFIKVFKIDVAYYTNPTSEIL